MWLINAHTLKLEEVWGESVKEYAILSHRWEDGEVSFQDMQNPAMASTKKGFAKIRKSCEHAVNDGYNNVWVDTCCINKDSSAELSEAINSMYRWYKASAVCYTYLSDVSANAFDSDIVEQQIKSSLWFTRGWTLQELIAPQQVVFYDQQWGVLGTKHTLSRLLSLNTGIDEAILNGESLSRYSISQRMSWASHRVTTRIEDIAYCLLGIFDVNMPMLYGEGEKAFIRLQEEIIKKSDDHTIFIWPIHRHGQPGLLADSPAAFENCHQVRTTTSRKGRSPYSLTNRGLSIKFIATQFKTDTYIVRLYCTDELSPADLHDTCCLGMFVRRLKEDDQYARVRHEGITIMQMKASIWSFQYMKNLKSTRLIDINVRQDCTELHTDYEKDRVNGFRIATPELLERSSLGKDRFMVSAPSWNPQERIMSMKPGDCGTVGFLDISQQNRMIKIIKLGFDFHYNPVCFIATALGDDAGADTSFTRKEENQARFEKFHLRSPFDMYPWSEVVNGNASLLKPGYGDFWALKGDRVNGLNVRIASLAELRITRGEFRDSLVWDVHLDNVKGQDFPQDL